ncbi:MAG: TonB family protein [Prevotellaceae bacterium]|jgi:TonB family protein|nr:TonB family protein [Prevotellaceae bacterium]
MNLGKKGKYIGITGALLIHVGILLLLIWVGFTVPQQTAEDGVPVMLGELPDAQGNTDPSLVKVSILPEPEAPELPDVDNQPLVTQNEEETVSMIPEESEAQKAEEARKQAEARAERERREAEETARQRVTNAFGRGTQTGSKGATEGETTQGVADGKKQEGATAHTNNSGTFNLEGRHLGEGGLPLPAYTVRDDGKVVITITVNPAGIVIRTEVNLRETTTVNSTLRNAAEEAAGKARFNSVEGVTNQTGTITYYFNLK